MQRDFVVQFRPASDPASGHFRGRVEHLDSGRSASFQTLEEFAALVARILAEIESPSRQ